MTSTPINDDTTQYFINQPVVNQPSTRYPMINFQPGDHVTVSAGGCVQTGGYGGSVTGGGTWKRYVNPSGSDADHWYWGTLTIPGILSEQRFDSGQVSGKVLVVPDLNRPARAPDPNSGDPGEAACKVSATMPLILGYKDDEYGDNGYWSHDDGDDDQCENSVNAWVSLTVTHGTPGPFPLAADWDLVPDCLDDNFIFQNPRWAWQMLGKQATYNRDDFANNQVTQTTTFDGIDDFITNWFLSFPPKIQKPFTCNLGSHGHRNWFEGTYTGTVKWKGHDNPILAPRELGPLPGPGDDDYNILMTPPLVGKTGIVASGLVDNPSQIKLEFDSDETIDHFGDDDRSDATTFWWWKKLRNAVDAANPVWDINADDTEVRSRIDGHQAIVIGLVGIDEEHDGGNEIHPVHALAMRTSPVYAQGFMPNVLQDHWSLFVRNWGNEGNCSSQDHELNLNDIVMRFEPSDPSVVNATVPVELSYANLRQNGGGSYSWYASPELDRPSLLVTFHLPNPTEQAWIAGELFINWTRTVPLPGSPPTGGGGVVIGGAGATTQLASIAPAAAAAVIAPPGGDDDYSEVWARLTLAQQNAFAVISSAITPPVVPQVIGPAPGAQIFTPPPRPARVPTVSVGPESPRHLQKLVALYTSFCAVTNGQVPDNPDACGPVPPVTLASASPALTAVTGCFFNPDLVSLDPIDASGSGIDFTEWSRDGGTTWHRYSGPFYAQLGATISYRSHDKNGNVEPVRKLVLERPDYSVAPEDLALFAQGTLRVDDGVRVVGSAAGSYAPIANAGAGETNIGVTADVGNLLSRGPVMLRDRSRVDGDVRTSAIVSYQNRSTITITGTLSEGVPLNLLDISACTVAFPAAIDNASLEPHRLRTLSPGSYGQADIKEGAALSLSTGTYYFDLLRLQPGSRVVLDQSQGPVFIFVRTTFDPKGRFVDAAGALASTFVGFFGTESVFMVSPFVGTVVAPNANVDLTGIPAPWVTGSLFAKDLEVSPYITVAQRPYDFWIGGPGPGEGGVTSGGSGGASGAGGSTGTGGSTGAGGSGAGGSGGAGACLQGWRSSSCGATCTGQTQSDRAECRTYLDCYAANNCGPTTCGGNDAVCGVNKLGGGTAPRDIANQVYACLCP